MTDTLIEPESTKTNIVPDNYEQVVKTICSETKASELDIETSEMDAPKNQTPPENIYKNCEEKVCKGNEYIVSDETTSPMKDVSELLRRKIGKYSHADTNPFFVLSYFSVRNKMNRSFRSTILVASSESDHNNQQNMKYCTSNRCDKFGCVTKNYTKNWLLK